MSLAFGLKSRLVLTSLIVYLAIGALAFIALGIVVGRVTERLGLAYAGKYALASSALIREPLDREITMARLMAESHVIREWVVDEANESKRAVAMKELEGYQRQFADKSWFLVVNPSLHYYFDDEAHRYGASKLAYTLATDAPKDQWYFATIKDVPDFALNVNYDPVLDTHKVWVNVVMRDLSGAPMGLAGTGSDLSLFLKTTVDQTEPGVENLLLDYRMAIQACRDRKMIDQHSVAKTSDELSTVRQIITGKEDIAAMEAAFEKLRAGSDVETFFATVNGRRQIVGAAHISSLRWYVLTVLNLDEVIGQHVFGPLLALGVALTLLLVLAVGFVVNRMLVAPLLKITAAARKISEGDYSVVLSSRRRDEIGLLGRTVSEMAATVRNHTENLEQRVKDRTEQLNLSNQRIQEQMEQLQEAMANVKTLEGILPICASCKKIRDDKGYWNQVESYVSERTSAEFSHGICPDCLQKLYPDENGKDHP